MVVQHNLRAMNSNRMLGLTANVQAKSTEKLSSGYKINRAADDAAGLSISEKMRKQIRGLSQASLNAQDGISAVQTAEGALNEVQDMLQRMNELAVKASNGTMSESDRSYVQNEIDQLVTEIDRVAETTKFNETYLLKGVEGTETVETAASIEVAYKEGITGENKLVWDPQVDVDANPIYATKEGESVKITDQNFDKFLQLNEKVEVQSAKIEDGKKVYDELGNRLGATQIVDKLNAGEKLYTNEGVEAELGTDYKNVHDEAIAEDHYSYTASTNGTTTITDAATTLNLTTDAVAIKIAGIANGGGDFTFTTSGTDGATNLASLVSAIDGLDNYNASEVDGKLVIEAVAQDAINKGEAVKAADITLGGAALAPGAAANVDSKDGDDSKFLALNASKFYKEDGTEITDTDLDGNITNEAKAYMDGLVTAQAGDPTVEVKIYRTPITQAPEDGRTVYDAEGNVLDAAAITKAVEDGIKMFSTAPTKAVEGTDYTVERETVEEFGAKEGYTIHSAGPANGQYGDQTVASKNVDLTQYVTSETDLLYSRNADGVTYSTVSAEELKNFFDEDGAYKGGLFKKNNLGTQTEIGAEQIDDYVNWNETEASTEEVAVNNALTLSLQVGADTTANNKISVDIESMGAKNLGVDGLKVDGKDSTNADAAVETIAAAIEKVSAQRSALGAVQNRLEHTIANLDNVVENTTAAESQIRDTDMATEMVKFSNNNILAQAGQAMLAQANQANQGVLSILG